MTKFNRNLKYIIAFLIGALVFATVGTIQKYLIYKIDPLLWYILPVFVGGTFGILIRFWWKHIKRKIQENKTLQQIVPCAVFTLNKKREITSWNLMAEDITGFSAEDVLGKQCDEILCDECLYECGNEKVSNPRSGIILKIKNKSGEYLTVLKNSDTIIDEKGELVFIESFTDITKIMEAEERLKEAKELAEKSSKLKTEFLAQMSHEIRTPINSLLSFSSFVEAEIQEHMNDDLRTSFKMINVGSKRVIRTIDLILDVAQLNSGMFELQNEYILLLEEIIEPICQEFNTLTANKNLKFSLTKDESEFVVYSDPYVFGQILLNLLDNAVKFTNAGEVKVNICKNEEGFVLEVSDTGIGISEDYMETLFTPFTQEDQGYSRKYEGNGLGLSLVKKYCDLLGAEISVESEINVGSVFKIQFPAKLLFQEEEKIS